LRKGVSKRTQRFVSIGATAAILAGYVIAVTSAEGIDRAELSLNDGGVWVTSTTNHPVARLNYPSREADGAHVAILAGVHNPAGVKAGHTADRVTGTWQLGAGWAQHGTAEIVLGPREGGSPPASPPSPHTAGS